MAIEDLFVLPAPLECPNLDMQLNFKQMDPQTTARAKTWIGKHHKMLRYDLFEGKLPILLSFDKEGNVLEVPGFIGIDVQQESFTARLVSDLYESIPSITSGYQLHFSLTPHRKGGEYTIFGRQGGTYSYFMHLGHELNIDSICVDVDNKIVTPAQGSNSPFLGVSMLHFYKIGDKIEKSMMIGLGDQYHRQFYEFDSNGNLKKVKASGIWQEINDMEEIRGELGGKKFKSRTLCELQRTVESYVVAMEKYKKQFGDLKKIDYEDVLKKSVGL
jgi:hypothetical protein